MDHTTAWELSPWIPGDLQTLHPIPLCPVLTLPAEPAAGEGNQQRNPISSHGVSAAQMPKAELIPICREWGAGVREQFIGLREGKEPGSLFPLTQLEVRVELYSKRSGTSFNSSSLGLLLEVGFMSFLFSPMEGSKDPSQLSNMTQSFSQSLQLNLLSVWYSHYG